MGGWPGDSAPLPHAVPEDRLSVRLSILARRRCACGHLFYSVDGPEQTPASWPDQIGWYDAGSA